MHVPYVLPVCSPEEGVAHYLQSSLADPVVCITEEAMDEVLGFGGDGRELRGEDEVLAPVHDLVVRLCGWSGAQGGVSVCVCECV